MEELFYELFNDLPRQGPGSKESTLKAFNVLPLENKDLQILDVGCGTGSQTMDLIKVINGKITAIDNYKPFIDELNRLAKLQNLENKLDARVGDMHNLDFENKKFDVIWSEGAIYIIGFEKGLAEWKRLLKDKGFLVVSEICWFKENHPKEILDFWKSEYPVGILTIEDKLRIAEKLNYKCVDHFKLPENCWNENYYSYLQKNVEKFKIKYESDKKALQLAEMFQIEINMYEKYSAYYGYEFFILQNLT